MRAKRPYWRGRFTVKDGCARRWSALGALLFLVLGSIVLAPLASPAEAAGRSLVLPIPRGQAWYVCQGYGGEISHDGIPALDLSRERRSVGPDGCMGKSKYSSAGSVVSSPAAGTAHRWPGCCGDDFVCVNLDSGGSVAIGHLSNRVPTGTVVSTGDRIGTVAWPHPMNGSYAHIHVQAHTEANCTEGGDPVAFDEAHGFKWACVPDLPYTGIPNGYSGLAVERCESSAATAADPRVEERDRTAKASWFLKRVVRCAWQVMSFAINPPRSG